MAAPGPRPATTANLRRIADTLGLPAEVFLEPADRPGQAPLAQILCDPDGLRIARAFADLTKDTDRRAIANTVEAIAAALNVKTAAKG